MAGFDEGAHPRGDGGKFTAGGGPSHAGGSRRQARQATKAARQASSEAKTAGDHRKAAGAHQQAAKAQLEAAKAHEKAASKETDPARKGEHLAAAANANAMAKQHDKAAGDHGDQAKTAPERSGPNSWLAEKIKGTREGVEHLGEKVQEFTEKTLKGNPLEVVKDAAGAIGKRVAMPWAGPDAMAAALADIAGRIGSGEKREKEGE